MALLPQTQVAKFFGDHTITASNLNTPLRWIRGIIHDMVNLWRRRKFVRLVRKIIKEHDKKYPPSLEAEEAYDPPKKEVKKAFTKKRKIWCVKFTVPEANNICREVLNYQYCTPKEAFGGVESLHLEQKGTELCSLSGYCEELIKGRKRLTTILVAVLLSSGFTVLVATILRAVF